jgi:hypothetical protein
MTKVVEVADKSVTFLFYYPESTVLPSISQSASLPAATTARRSATMVQHQAANYTDTDDPKAWPAQTSYGMGEGTSTDTAVTTSSPTAYAPPVVFSTYQLNDTTSIGYDTHTEIGSKE